MLRPRSKRELIMVLWQFTAIAVLIGALLAYVGVLSNRIGNTNAILKRIEGWLLAADRRTEHSPVAAAAVSQAPEVAEPRQALESMQVAAEAVTATESITMAQLTELSVKGTAPPPGYLTIRD